MLCRWLPLFALLFLTACTVGEPDVPLPALSAGQSASSTFGDVEAVATFEADPDRIVSTLTDAGGGLGFTMVWYLEDERIEVETETESFAVPIEDDRLRAPSLPAANQLAHDLWAARPDAGDGTNAYLLWDGSCPNGHLRCVGWSYVCYPILECWPVQRCEVVLTCTPDGCTETEQCHQEIHCQYRNYCTQTCNEWGCQTD